MGIAQAGAFQEHTGVQPRLERLDDRTILVRAAAKVNFTLAVGAQRPDGYHAFESLMATVTLCDELTIRRGRSGIRIHCDEADVPVDTGNLVHRACSLLGWQAKVEPGVDMDLVKRIPTEAGLGGASSDAAACLLGLNELWGLHFPVEKLNEVAAVLGSDVSFFLSGPLAICKGRGEQVCPLNFHWEFWAVVIQPPGKLATRDVYKSHRVSDPSCFGLAEQLTQSLPGGRPSSVCGRFCNDLEPAAFRLNSGLEQLRANLEAGGQVPVRLTGSGSAMFAVFDTRDQAVQFVQRINQLYPALVSWLVKNNLW